MGVSGIILAGGRSSRMGRDKTLLSLHHHETLIERTVKAVAEFADEIIIASNNTAKYKLAGCREVPDIYPGRGPLAGLHAGLITARHHYAFVVSGDMPFFTADLARFLLDRKTGYDGVVPAVRGCWEPLCAVYSRNCINAIETCLQAGVSQVFQFYPNVNILRINESALQRVGNLKKLFYNLNTPEDVSYLLQQEEAAAASEPS